MKCPKCQHFNRADAKFCEECAAPLVRICAHCGQGLSPSAKFCPECGQPAGSSDQSPFGPPQTYTPRHLAEKILTSKAALEGERKQVTVLFADLKGSMELLADRDPEEARKLLDPVLKHMMDAVHHYEGTVSLVMGDGIMALFGAPIAHEDHAVRACFAALRMQALVKRYAEDARHAHGVNVQIRVGLNSGEVVVRAIGSDLHMDYTAQGRTTHLAARMEQLASPGSILLAPSTLDLAEGFVAVRPLGPVPVKGLADAVDIFELTDAHQSQTRFQASVRRGLTRFVGRTAELKQLHRARQLAGEGRGQVVALVAEAGVGKSRLLYEFSHAHRFQEWMALECGAVSYGKAMSYLPVINLLKDYFKIRDRDDGREIREKVMGKVLALDRALESTLQALLALLDVLVDDPSAGAGEAAAWQALAPAERRQCTFDAVKRLLLREARAQPLLVIIEDLHWIDGETQALLDTLVDGLGSARLLLLVNYRPEYQHGWGGKTCYSQIRLDALPAETAGELLDALLGDDPALGPLKKLLVRRGNPFFLEETIRTLVETKALAGERGLYRLTQPIQAVQVPATVQTILAARIDRLAPEDKRLLQTASVIGKDVPFAVLQAMAGLPDEALRRGLDRLQTAEFIYEAGLFPDIEYTFKHALTHEVTYGGLLQEPRRALHARIVAAIETLHHDRLDEHIERLAYHARHGELGEKAVEYLQHAGQKAAARSALSDARVWFEQALGVLAGLSETKATLEPGFEIRLELRHMLFQLGDVRRGLERLREAETIAERLNDDRRRGRVWAALIHVHSNLGEFDEALVAGTRALEYAARLGDLRLRIQTTSYVAQVHGRRGDYQRVIELATTNLATLPADWVQESFSLPAPASVFDRLSLLTSFAQLGRFAEAARCGAEMLPLVESTHLPFAIGFAHHAMAAFRQLQGDWAQAHAPVERAVALFRTSNVLITLPGAVATSAYVLAQLGEAREALTRLRKGEELLERLAAHGMIANLSGAYHSLGRACFVLGRLDDARRLVDRAVECSSGQQGVMGHALQLLGDIATHPDRFDAEAGEAHYRQALALAEPRGMRPLIAHCHFGLGKLYQRTGKQNEAREHLATATAMYRDMDMRFWLGPAEAILAEVRA